MFRISLLRELGYSKKEIFTLEELHDRNIPKEQILLMGFTNEELRCYERCNVAFTNDALHEAVRLWIKDKTLALEYFRSYCKLECQQGDFNEGFIRRIVPNLMMILTNGM